MNNLKYHENIFKGSREDLIALIKKSVSEHRFQHILRVEKVAIKLAKLNEYDVEKVSIAALVHDYAKEKSADEFKEVIEKKKMPRNLIKWNNFIWHGVVGAEIIRDELKIDNEDILNAVRRHTVGSADMTTLDKIIYVADYIEDGRDFPGVKIARVLAYANLNAAVAYETKHVIEYLISQNKVIYPAAILTYNKWVTN